MYACNARLLLLLRRKLDYTVANPDLHYGVDYSLQAIFIITEYLKQFEINSEDYNQGLDEILSVMQRYQKENNCYGALIHELEQLPRPITSDILDDLLINIILFKDQRYQRDQSIHIKENRIEQLT
ncbi:MAG: hypothetical protein OEY79_03140, partial [Anaplasmataceae bacterium]|nr:hypothetical protein [Anaplasmataceae bacterium]